MINLTMLIGRPLRSMTENNSSYVPNLDLKRIGQKPFYITVVSLKEIEIFMDICTFESGHSIKGF